MILGAEIGLLIVGIMALVRGKLPLTKKRVVYGLPARLLAIIALLPIPVTFVAAIVFAIVMDTRGQNPASSAVRWTGAGIEAAIVILCIAAMYGIGWRLGTDANAPPGAPPPPPV